MKRAIITVLFVLSMLIVSCGTSDPQAQTGSVFKGGSQGVLAHFEPFGVEESGIQSIFDSEAFPIEVTVNNKGEYKIQPADIDVELLGPSTEEFQGIASRTLANQDELEEISDLSPEGGEETIAFASDARFNGEVTNYLDRDWFANLEYNYKTYLVIPEVCLKEDLTDDRVCNVNEKKSFFVSGSPITVESVEQDTAGKGVMALKIKIKNTGTGDVTKVGSEFDETREELAFSIDDADWECKSAGKVNEARLYNGQAELLCKLKNPLDADELSTKQVRLTFDFRYRELVKQSLRIKESAN
ncbi:hypothetical protein HYV86_05265 [Candidatus Woesearchaeota archaeon]|nr:hypothetical protein [Candidatus Woesearchaeota archaeon]